MTMMKDLAESAATSAAEKVSGELRLEMADMEARLKDSFDEKISAILGMSAIDHALQHQELKNLSRDFKRQKEERWFTPALRGRMIAAILVLLGSLAASLTHLPADSTKAIIAILSGDYRRENLAYPTTESEK